MHRTIGTKFGFGHHGDFSGDVWIYALDGDAELEVPFDDLKTLVAAYVRDLMIKALEEASDDEVLGTYVE